MDVRQIHKFWILLVILFQLFSAHASAADCGTIVATFVSIEGHVEMRESDGITWHTAQLEQTLCPGDTVKLGANSRAAIILSNHTLVRLDAFTTLKVTGQADEESFWVELVQGIAHFMSRVPRKLKVNTPFVNAGVDGTEFLVQVDDSESFLSVFEGQVSLDNEAGKLSLASGESAVTRKDEVPLMQVVVRPQDAVQWVLYYPTILEFDLSEFDNYQELGWQSRVARSIQLYQQRDLSAAIAALEDISGSIRDPRFFTYRASLHLTVGRVTSAQTDIEQALTLNPDDGNALALRSIIAVVQNNNDQALELANRAVTAAPTDAGPVLALSYALQARFELAEARDALKKAVTINPDNALLWSRLAELHLMFRDLGRALDAAERATSIDPNVAHTQMVLGYAQLIRIDFKSAKSAFAKAIELDQGAPLQRLGLGLALIREGNLSDGRREIEVAAILDPGNALIRSYLGKAYYEEKRDDLAGDQYGIAKELDPMDPTAFFYDAIRKQAHNRPVEALQDLQTSIDRNDNRAVFRSRLLLDEDIAARSASLARIYNDLGFEQRAQFEAKTSLNYSPGNFSAHRFLADSYAGLPRHEIARTSELLQSQLLQPLNVTPIQPQLTQTNLAMLGGIRPAELSFNEFNPLFASNGPAFRIDGVVGSNNTLGNNLILSAIKGRTSFSLGHYGFETEGFRANDDLQQEINNLFGQISINNKSSIQIEVRTEKTDAGDVTLFFNELHRPDLRQDIEQDVARVGFHYRPTPRQVVVVSAIYSDRQESEKNLNRPPPPIPVVGVLQTVVDEQGYNNELQHQYRGNQFSTIVGLGYVDADGSLTRSQKVLEREGGPEIPGFSLSTTSQFDKDHFNTYLYSDVNLNPNSTLTVGASYDSYQGPSVEDGKSQFNPKLGFRWTPAVATVIRLAAFRVLKRSLVTNQTIEPTQVTGFNQFFDDLDGASSWRGGVGLDHRFSANSFAGFELSWRDITQPVNSDGEVIDRNVDEVSHRAYINWILRRELTLSTELYYEEFDREFTAGIGDPTNPKKIETYYLPLKLSYHNIVGLFAKLGPTYVNQNVDFVTDTGLDFDSESFWVTDLSVGYRLPKRFGLISLDVTNLFDKSFRYQGAFDTAKPQLSRFQPGRMIFFNISLKF